MVVLYYDYTTVQWYHACAWAVLCSWLWVWWLSSYQGGTNAQLQPVLRAPRQYSSGTRSFFFPHMPMPNFPQYHLSPHVHAESLPSLMQTSPNWAQVPRCYTEECYCTYVLCSTVVGHSVLLQVNSSR